MHSSVFALYLPSLPIDLTACAPCHSYEKMASTAYEANPDLVEAACADLHRILELDPAANGFLHPFMFFKGFHSVQCGATGRSHTRRASLESHYSRSALTR